MKLNAAQTKALDDLKKRRESGEALALALDPVLESAILQYLGKESKEDDKQLVAILQALVNKPNNAPVINVPNYKQELDFIGKAIRENTVAVKKNTETANRMIEVMMMPRKPSYDYEGKIIELRVGK
jgi:hypothetical protein